MFGRNTATAIVIISLFLGLTGFAQELEENWNDFLHYTKIGRLDLAKGHAQVILNSSPDSVELLALSEQNPQGYTILLKVTESTSDVDLAQLTQKLLNIIEQGRFERRADPKIIIQEIERVTTATTRGQLAAVKRLRNAGEYAIMYMLDEMANTSDKEKIANIVWALPQIGRDAIRPLVAALQTEKVAIKAEIIQALGKIGYPQSLAYLKYIIEKDASAQLRDFAEQSINEIDPAAMKIPSAQLFYRLAENYYYHAQSLSPAEDADIGNIWFWDAENRRLAREAVDKSYFYELMAMRTCEWALKADPGFGKAIGLWIASYCKAEATGTSMPEFFGSGHADAMTYATTAGPEYLHQALARAVKDNNGAVAHSVIESLAKAAGEKSLLYQLGPEQPLAEALSFDDKAVRYSAAIAIAAVGPTQGFPESKLVIENLAQAIVEIADVATENEGLWSGDMANDYAIRAATVMLKLAQTKNTFIDLSAAQAALINATKDARPQIQALSGLVLAHLQSPNAQRAIAAMAIDQTNNIGIRIAAFNSLATSAKFNANLLDNETINSIYNLVSSQQIDPQLRSSAASAFGALNLPSRKVKDLILDQAKS